MIQLTRDQDVAMARINAWMGNDAEWMFYLAGYAGTGKTTLLHQLINNLSDPPLCLAPTGKAASVLQKRLTTAEVTTIHRAIYKPVLPDISRLQRLEMELAETKNEALKQAIRDEKERLMRLRLKFNDNEEHGITPGSLVIVDEASMVTSKMLCDLEKTQAKILFVGDPGQLPPVGDEGYFHRRKPDAMLSQVMRQALDNPIVALSMAIRNGDTIPRTINDGAITRRSRKDFDVAEFKNWDQILTGKNVIRRKLNRICRKLAGFEDSLMPVKGETIICLKNRFKFDTWMINGVMGYTTKGADVNAKGDWVFDIMYEGNVLADLPFYDYPFLAHYRQDAVEEPWAMRSDLAEFDYGYAITVHKSQGSEWDNVALVDDGMFNNDRKTRQKWLYTAVTRAKQKLLWVDMS